MKVLSELTIWVTAGDVPEDVNKKWVEMTIANAELGNDRRKRKIKTNVDFEGMVAGVSSQAYEKYINPDFVSKSGLNKQEITIKHHKNLVQSYPKYINKLDYMFATVDGIPAKRYKEIIQNTAQNYGKNVAEKLLAFTGMRSRSDGCAVMAMKWLDGAQISGIKEFIGHMSGGPIIIAGDGLRSTFRAGLEQRLIQAGATIFRSDFNPDVVKKQNGITNRYLTSQSDPALNLAPFTTGGASHVDYLAPTPDAGFRLEIKVSQR